MIKNILITGANGYIGSHVVKELCTNCKDQFLVTAMDLDNSHLEKDVNIIIGDIMQLADKPQLYELVGKPDICIYLAWQDGFDHNANSHMENLYLHYKFLTNLIDHGTRQLIIAGSFREYGKCAGQVQEELEVPADNLYVLAKKTLRRAIEIYCEGKNVCIQWIRPFTVYGDDALNNSIMSKILRWEDEGKNFFPFTMGLEEYDYIEVNELAKQIVAIAKQTRIDGAINCCSGKPTRLKDKIEQFIEENHLKIRPEYGAFPTRAYDSSVIYGDTSKIEKIMEMVK